MQIFFLLIMFLMLVIIFFVIRSLILGKKSIPVALFSEALRNENNGHFEEALVAYENALKENQKTRFPNQHLSKSIMQKLKVLNTAIDYQKNVNKRT